MEVSVKGFSEKVFQILIVLLLVALAICALMPFVMLVASSLSTESTLFREGYSFWPRDFTIYAYEYLFQVSFNDISRAFGMSILVTVIGTFLHMLIAPMLAYPLSRPDYERGRLVMFLIFFAMMFNGGMVGQYLMWTNLFNIENTIFALILPNLILNPFNIILYRNYFANNIHPAIVEAAKIDGASELFLYYRVVLPLSLPILAAMGLIMGIGYWNDWINGQYYITDKSLYTLQVLLNKVIQSLQTLLTMGGMGSASASQLPSISIRMAIAVVGMLPIIVLYPFFQKAFVKGISIGGVKE